MEPGTVINKSYKIIQKIGEGGMGEVFEALHIKSEQRVALKVLYPQITSQKTAITRFFREAQASIEAGRSKHIVKVIEMGELECGTPFMVMEYLEGSELRKILQKEKSLESERALDIVLQICEGLAEAHGQGIVHRDLKPENVFITQDDDGNDLVKILDFGIAKFSISPDMDPKTLTVGFQISGTPVYMAPERFDGSGKADHRVDIYSLGVMLYEMLTGTFPYDAEDIQDLLMDILMETPKMPRERCPDISKGLEYVVMKAMSRNIEKRFTAIDELADELRPFTKKGGEKGSTLQSHNLYNFNDFFPDPKGKKSG